MTSSFAITPVERGIVRCRHTGEFSPDDIQSLATFMLDYRGKLLIDLTGTTGEECSRHIKNFRPMMPTAAIFGAPIDPSILDVSDSYYTHDVQYFETEEEALQWLESA